MTIKYNNITYSHMTFYDNRYCYVYAKRVYASRVQSPAVIIIHRRNRIPSVVIVYN